MRMKKIGLLGLALVLALALTGAGFAHWSDTVEIDATVEMGDFLVGWQDILEETDNEDLNDPPKDVGTVIQALTEPETGVHHTPVQTVYKMLTITVTNGYPQYKSHCKVTLKNAGTIPAHVVDVIVTPGAGLVLGDISLDANGNPIDWELIDTDNGNVALDLEIFKQANGLSLVCNQLEPCTTEEVDIDIEIKQDGAEECNTYTFSVEIIAVQWNKAAEYPF